MEEMSADIGHSSDCIELAVAGLVFGQCGSKASGCKGEHFNRGLILGLFKCLTKAVYMINIGTVQPNSPLRIPIIFSVYGSNRDSRILHIIFFVGSKNDTPRQLLQSVLSPFL